VKGNSMLKVICGVEVDIVGHNFEHSPDINVFGFEYVTATDMDNQPFELTDEEQEALCIELTNDYYDNPGDDYE
jgi:hypothetical protein